MSKSEGLTFTQLQEENAKLVTENVKLKAERDAMASENATLKEYLNECSVVQGEGNWTNDVEKSVYVPAAEWMPPTPVTDAFLNSVRANAIDSAAEKAGGFANQCKVGSSTWHKWKSVVMFLVGESHTRRAGKDGE